MLKNIKHQGNVYQNYETSFHSRYSDYCPNMIQNNKSSRSTEKGELCTRAGNVVYCRHCGNHYGFPPQSRTSSSIDPAFSPLCVHPKIFKSVCQTDICCTLMPDSTPPSRIEIQNPLSYPSVYEWIKKILWA